MVHDCIVVQPLTTVLINSDDEFVESDVVIDDSDEDGLGQKMEGLEVGS
jgi:hypothetical protein